jgi:plasmid stabilization system protein ParE
LPLVHQVIFSRAASAELIEAQAWYEKEAPGWGRRFRHEVDAVIECVSASPQQYSMIYKNVRRALLRRFPYALLFVIEPDDTLLVIACFHGSRDPQHWQKRA